MSFYLEAYKFMYSVICLISIFVNLVEFVFAFEFCPRLCSTCHVKCNEPSVTMHAHNVIGISRHLVFINFGFGILSLINSCIHSNSLCNVFLTASQLYNFFHNSCIHCHTMSSLMEMSSYYNSNFCSFFLCTFDHVHTLMTHRICIQF